MKPAYSPGLPRRLAALIYDTFLVLPAVMLVAAGALGLQSLLTETPDGAELGTNTLHPQLVQLLAIITIAAFYCIFWRLKGQTLGMQAWRIKLRSMHTGDEAAANISLRQALLRCAGALVSALALGAGYWWCLFDRHGRYWHDYLSGTELELLPKG